MLISNNNSSMGNKKKIFVNFGSLKHPTQVKCILIPNSTQSNDVAVLRNLLYKELLADCSIISLGGSKLTPINDVLLLKHDEDYRQAIDSVRLRCLIMWKKILF